MKIYRRGDNNMSKKELIALVAERANMPATTAGKVYDAVFEVLTEEIIKGGVRIDAFGTFKVATKKERVAKNPRTGEEVKVPARKAVKFAPAAALKDKVQ